MAVKNVVIGWSAQKNISVIKERLFPVFLSIPNLTDSHHLSVLTSKEEIDDAVSMGDVDVLVIAEEINGTPIGKGTIRQYLNAKEDIKVILIIKGERLAAGKLWGLYGYGYYDALFEKDFTKNNLTKLIAKSRTAPDAYDYYQLDNFKNPLDSAEDVKPSREDESIGDDSKDNRASDRTGRKPVRAEAARGNKRPDRADDAINAPMKPARKQHREAPTDNDFSDVVGGEASAMFFETLEGSTARNGDRKGGKKAPSRNGSDNAKSNDGRGRRPKSGNRQDNAGSSDGSNKPDKPDKPDKPNSPDAAEGSAKPVGQQRGRTQGGRNNSTSRGRQKGKDALNSESTSKSGGSVRLLKKRPQREDPVDEAYEGETNEADVADKANNTIAYGNDGTIHEPADSIDTGEAHEEVDEDSNDEAAMEPLGAGSNADEGHDGYDGYDVEYAEDGGMEAAEDDPSDAEDPYPGDGDGDASYPVDYGDGMADMADTTDGYGAVGYGPEGSLEDYGEGYGDSYGEGYGDNNGTDGYDVSEDPDDPDGLAASSGERTDERLPVPEAGSSQFFTMTDREVESYLRKEDSTLQKPRLIGHEPDRLLDEKEKLLRHFIKEEPVPMSNLERGLMSREDFSQYVIKYITSMHPKSDDDAKELYDDFMRFMFGYDVLTPLINDPLVSDIKCYTYDNVRIKLRGERLEARVGFRSKDHYNAFVSHLARQNNTSINSGEAIVHFSDTTSFKNVRLRLNISTEYVNSNNSPCVHIRKENTQKYTTDELIREKMFSPRTAAYLINAAQNDGGIVFTGKGSAGKTTVMNWLIDYIPRDKSGICIQESDELFSDVHPDILFQRIADIKTRQFTHDKQAVMESYDLKNLSVNALLTDVDYFIIGEIKGAEARYFLNAAYTGNRCWASVHSPSSQDALEKIADYATYESAYTRDELLKMLTSLKTVVFLKDFRVREISRVAGWDAVHKAVRYEKVPLIA